MLGKKGLLEILKALSGNARTFTDLKKSQPNPKTLTERLRELAEYNLITNVNGLYSLTDKGERVSNLILKAVEIIKGGFEVKNLDRIPHSRYAPLIKKYCELLHDKYGAGLRAIVLFGSCARGDWDKHSDVDILVVVDDWEGKAWNRITELQEVKEKLRSTEEFERLVGSGYVPAIQHYPLSTSEAKAFHRIYLDMCLDGVILYDKDNFIENVLQGVRDRLMAEKARRIQLPNGSYYWILKPVEI